MPSEPAEYDFKERVRNIAYPTVEVGDVIWTYMGPPEKQPAPPAFEWATVPSTHRHVDRMVEECNWLQALEGGVDSAHSSFLHRSLLKDLTCALDSASTAIALAAAIRFWRSS
jgi:phenylpropionate dioxygenase-like ring-hydroxylating dioxygenase large terminal subunit